MILNRIPPHQSGIEQHERRSWKAERRRCRSCNHLPTSFSLPPEAVDGLRAPAATIILESPDARQVLNDADARLEEEPGSKSSK